ncbi:MAG TPA: DUF4360 domain-containing protein [Oligoflexus sp.]|uniref:DUF4360 domain-containing protein n=1 Tax=Oligoflexus sp. TaxID=1971216 RepID=UPI002D729CC7|nr:DUF4360 domain-containing protein [Oligoflexus sp.]HYX32864.1 DUF4360 domain-containing protein [Oligoflexus sp.]
MTSFKSLLALALLSGSALASPDKKIETLTFHGSGCPTATDQNIVVTDDERTISIFFNSFVAETTPDQSRVQKNCRISFHMNLPAATMVRLETMDYRGFAYPSLRVKRKDKVKTTGKAILRRVYFNDRDKELGETKISTFDEDTTEFNLHDEIHSVTSSRCGGRTVLHANVIAIADRGRDPEEQTSIGVDTLDVHHELQQVLRVSYIPCPAPRS